VEPVNEFDVNVQFMRFPFPSAFHVVATLGRRKTFLNRIMPFHSLSSYAHLSLLIFLLCSFLSVVHLKPFENLPYVLDYQSPESLEFSGGDVICCRIDRSIWSTFYGAEHAMLATDTQKVVHLVVHPTGGQHSEAYLTDLGISDGYSKCRVANGQYDAIMFARGVTFRDPVESVR